MADSTYQPAVYRKQAGNEFVVASGGTLTIESGGTLDIQSGAVLDIDVDYDLGDSEYLTFGDSEDVKMTFDGTSFVVVSAADDTLIEIGDAGATQKSFDLKIYGNAANGADYFTFDASASALVFGGAARIDMSAANIAAANTDGGLVKAGTSVAPVTEDTANMKFMSFYFDDGATSGDARGMYLRLYLTGAGGGGEAARIFTTVDDVAGATAHGAHISLNFDATGSVTGLGVAGRNTVHVPNAALTGGTYAALQAEIYAEGASSDVAGATAYSFLRVVADGNATGKANVDANAVLIDFSGVTAASGTLIDTDITTHTAYGGIPVNIPGVGVRYIALVSA